MARPYVQVAEFQAYPNYLDLNDLVPNGTEQQQLAELTNTLLRSTALVDAYCRARRGMDAHAAVDVSTAHLNPVTREAAVRLKDGPLVQVTSISLAPAGLQGVRPVTVPAANAYVLDGMLRIPAPNAIPGYRGRVIATVSYIAGWPVTALAAPTHLGDLAVSVVDPTGVLPGTVLRLWDPGVEEFVTAAVGYTPGQPLVPLASPLLGAHSTGAAADAMPPDLHEAVILWTMGLLARPTSGGDEDPFSDSTGDGPTTTGKDPRRSGAGLIRGAKELLDEGGYVRAAG